nr:serine/threonine protein phosphatase [Candidatus Cloacimonadota bacterium]
MTEQKEELFFEIAYQQINKHDEELCGDAILINKSPHLTTVILSDGLGSGVKASILATLTSKIISVMIENECSIEEILDTLVSTLPT